jgi:lysophospholipase L1-like esterase
MTTLSSRPSRRVALAATLGAVSVAAAAISMVGIGSSAAAGTGRAAGATRPPVVAGSRYLALGDSVSFGYRESNSIPTPNYAKPNSFVGFPEDVAANLGLTLTNASCPGETSASLINVKAQSNGCENTFVKGSPPVPGGYRTVHPLHIRYASSAESQLTFAERYLRAHPNTRLVSLMVGANDGFICLNKYSDGCVSEFGALQKTVAANATKIFKGLRVTAHYGGQIVLVTYYSMDYSNSIDNLESQGLNSALKAAAKPFNVEVADAYGQFQIATRQAAGNTCTAGLLTVLSGGTTPCGIHPSPAGAAVLAQAVERAIKK